MRPPVRVRRHYKPSGIANRSVAPKPWVSSWLATVAFVQAQENSWKMQHLFLGIQVSKFKQTRRHSTEGDTVKDPQDAQFGKRAKNGWKNSALPWTYALDPKLLPSGAAK